MGEDAPSKGLQYQEQQQQQRSIPTSPSPSPMQPQYRTGQSIHNPANDEEEEEETISEDTKLKMYELRWLLLHKYPQFHPDPIELINNIVNSYLQGDYKPLDDTLKQLRALTYLKSDNVRMHLE